LIDTGDGDDKITIDSTRGPIAVPGKINIKGGAQSNLPGVGDDLIFKNAAANSALAPTSIVTSLIT
jgi:hypothetical protein